MRCVPGDRFWTPGSVSVLGDRGLADLRGPGTCPRRVHLRSDGQRGRDSELSKEPQCAKWILLSTRGHAGPRLWYFIFIFQVAPCTHCGSCEGVFRLSLLASCVKHPTHHCTHSSRRPEIVLAMCLTDEPDKVAKQPSTASRDRL